MATLSARLTMQAGLTRPVFGWARSAGGVSEPDAHREEPAASRDVSAMSLSDLTAAASQGDEAAFAALNRRVGAGLRRLLLKRSGGRADLVDDLLQTTWAAVWQSLKSGKYDPDRAAITTFVYAVGHNAWLTHLRKTSRDRIAGQTEVPGAGQPAEGSAVGESPAHDVLAQAEAAELVRSCLRDGTVAGLSDQERSIIRCIAAGESDRGLARRLGISCSTVNVKKHSGLAKIRAYLERCGIEEPGESRSQQGAASHRERAQDIGGASPGLIGGMS